MFEINGTFLIFVLSFLIFIKLLDEVMLKPIGSVLEKRAEKIKADIEEGKVHRNKAQYVFDQYQKHLHDIRAKAQTIINEASEKASYHRNLELTRVKEEGHKQLEEAKAVLASQRTIAINGLLEQEVKLVEGITQKLLGEPVSVILEADTVRRALEEAS